jgi:hypothetical protein
MQPQPACEFFAILADVHNRLHAAFDIVPQDKAEIDDVAAMLIQIVERLNVQVERPLTTRESALLSEINSTTARLSARLVRIANGLQEFEKFESSAVQ